MLEKGKLFKITRDTTNNGYWDKLELDRDENEKSKR